jgi:uncharacterized protein (TIGR03435 family)
MNIRGMMFALSKTEIRPILSASVLLLGAVAAFGQRQDDHRTFEVASVRAAGSNSLAEFNPRGGPGTNDPGRISYRNNSLRSLVMSAYNLTLSHELEGPSWMDQQKYDIVANVPYGTTKEQLKIMLQNLLKDRFRLAIHHVSRIVPGYEMAIAKGGLRLREAVAAPPTVPDPPVAATPEKDRRPTSGVLLSKQAAPLILPPGDRWAVVPRACPPSTSLTLCGHARVLARGQTMPAIAEMVRSLLKRPTVDKTGVGGKYDFTLDFSPESIGIILPAPDGQAAGGATVLDDPRPNFELALESQLGLKLTNSRISADVIVIDHVERQPTEN